MATWPWVARFEWHQVEIKKYENIVIWYKNIGLRNAVIKGYDIPTIGASIPRV